MKDYFDFYHKYYLKEVITLSNNEIIRHVIHKTYIQYWSVFLPNTWLVEFYISSCGSRANTYVNTKEY